MRYIRTKDGLFTIEENIYNQVFAVDNKGEWIEFEYVKDKILAEADNIEELCDEIVVKENPSSKPRLLGRIVDFDENGEKYYTGEYSFKGIAYTLNELMERYKEMSVKGAIWTDDGLTYVTEFNENKGE